MVCAGARTVATLEKAREVSLRAVVATQAFGVKVKAEVTAKVAKCAAVATKAKEW